MEDNSKSGGESQSAVGVIYKITCLINGKSYVGQTRQKFEVRISQHKHNSNRTPIGIDAAIKKYGWENFTVEIIEECAIEKLDEREMFWIATLNSKSPNGYNLTNGGKGNDPSPETRAKISANHADVSGENNPFYGKKHTEETCAKMSAAKKGKPRKPHSQETRDKIATSNKGKHSHNKGKPSPKKGKSLSAETCAKMSAAHKGKKISPETCAKIAARNKGENHPLYGKHHSEETRAKMRVAHARRKKEVENNGGT